MRRQEEWDSSPLLVRLLRASGQSREIEVVRQYLADRGAVLTPSELTAAVTRTSEIVRREFGAITVLTLAEWGEPP